MKKIMTFILSLSLFVNIYSVQAKDLVEKWALGIAGGIGFILDPKEASDYFPTAYVISGDLTYMFKKHIGIIPIAVSYDRLNFDKNKYGNSNDMDIPRSVLDELDTSVWFLGFTPGILFSSSGTNKVRVFGQAGAGIYHLKWVYEAPSVNYKYNNTENDFGMNFGGGIEVDIAKKAALVGKTRFDWIASKYESTTEFIIMGGIKYYF